MPLIGSGWATHDPQHWPADVLADLKANEPKPGEPNKLFNAGYIDGGFVIYHAPGYKVFVDDRCELFGGPWLKEFVEAQDAPRRRSAKWEAQYGPFDFALTRTGTPFDDWFENSPAWRPVRAVRPAVAPVPNARLYKRRLARAAPRRRPSGGRPVPPPDRA